MAVNVYQVWRDGFDNMENHDPYVSELLATFVDDPEGVEERKLAYTKTGEFIRSVDVGRFYLGYDGKVYPRLRVVKEVAQ